MDRRKDWVPAIYEMVTMLGEIKVPGYAHKGLGLYWSHSLQFWRVTHLNTGLLLCDIHRQLPFEIASQISDLGDWSFQTMEGFRNSDPQLLDRLDAFVAANKPHVRRNKRVLEHPNQDFADVAQAMAARVLTHRLNDPSPTDGNGETA